MTNRMRGCLCLCAALLTLLAGCGQTGALVLPGQLQEPAAEQSAQPGDEEDEDDE